MIPLQAEAAAAAVPAVPERLLHGQAAEPVLYRATAQTRLEIM